MALPSDLNSIIVTGKYVDSSGAALTGSITFTPSTTLTDPTGTVVIPAIGRTYPLTAGSFVTDPLVATDDSTLSPAGWTYTVQVALQNVPPSSYSVLVPHAPFTYTATNATPCVFTATGSAYANGTAVSLAGSPPTGFTAGSTYYVVSASGTTFRLAATVGGSAIASTSTGSGTVSTASLDISALTPVVSPGTPTSYVPSTGGTFTGDVTFAGSPSLTIPSGAATGQVLTSDSAGNAVWAAPALVVKPAVQEATAVALPSNTYASGVLTASGNGALTVDGIAVSAADRVLVKNEVSALKNGVYVVTSTGSAGTPYVLTRSSDMNIAADIPAAFVFVEQGTANAGQGYMVTGIGPWTLGTTAINWTQFSGAQIVAGTGISVAGSTVSLTTPVAPANLPAATASAQGIVELAGDLGGTATSPTVTSTHLTAALPIAQGGTSAATAPNALSALGGAAVAGDIGGTSASPQVTATHLASALPVNQGGTGSTAQNFTSLLTPTGVKTANYTAVAGDLVTTDTSGGSFTITLPTAPAANTMIGVKQVTVAGVGTNATTVTAGGSDVFNKTGGLTTFTLDRLNQTVIMQYNSGIWIVQSTDPATGQIATARDGIYYLDSYTGNDDAKMTAALTAVFAAGGGTIQLSPRTHTFANQWATTYSPGVETNLRICGSGASPHGQSEGDPIGTTTCVLNYAGGAVARLNFQHSGALEVDHILFKDTAGSTVPFLQMTNAQPYIHDCAFRGNQTGTACNQDAIYFGGLGTVTGAGDTAPFQAYEGVVERCSFYGIRTACWARAYANNISMRDLLIDGNCGSPNTIAVTDGAMTAASATLTCATSTPFTSGMVGAVVLVTGAGYANVNSLLAATITAFTSSSVVTLSVAATQTVSGATVKMPVAAAFNLGCQPIATGGVQGCVIDDCCIETSGYAVGVLLQRSTGNAVIGSSFWDGVAGVSYTSIACVTSSYGNVFIIPEQNQPAGTPVSVTDTAPGQDMIISGTLTGRMAQLPGMTLMGSNALNLYANSAGGLNFGPPGGPGDATVQRDSAGNLNVTLSFGAATLFHVFAQGLTAGQTTNFVQIGTGGTSNCYVMALGSSANLTLNLTSKGTSPITLGNHTGASYAGTPTIAAGAGAGTSPTVSVTGNDQRGVISITTGTTPAAGLLATLTFNVSWAAVGAPYVVVCGAAALAGALSPWVGTISTTTFQLQCDGTPAASTAYKFNYIVLG